jgi:hypothetical protein
VDPRTRKAKRPARLQRFEITSVGAVVDVKPVDHGTVDWHLTGPISYR